MGLRETIQIILRAEDQATQVIKQNEQNMKKFGDTAKQANQKAAQTTQLAEKEMKNLSNHISGVVKSTDKISQGTTKFNQYTKSVNESQIAFKRLDSETQNMLRYLSQMSDEGREAFLGMSSKAQEAVSKFNEMKNATNGWNNTLDISKTKLKLLGTDVGSLKGKIQVVGNAIPTYLGAKWEVVKTKVTSLGNHIKSHLSNALKTVKNGIQSLADKFSGLGGVISSVFGGIGMKGIYDMTVGSSIAREQIHTLTDSVIGLGNGAYSYWDTMDKMTNNSLVSLDELGTAMNTIGMATGANTTQLKGLMPVVNDIGQRAILMGRDGQEAISLMQAAGKGLNGEFSMLQDNFGITKDKLMDLGWDGSAEDVQGYTRALQEYLDNGGKLDDMMGTTSGKITVLGKNFRIASRQIGDQFIPYINDALDFMIDMTETCDENNNSVFKYVSQAAVGAMALASGFATVAPTLAPVLSALHDIKDGASWAGEKVKGLKDYLFGVGEDKGALTKLKEKFQNLKEKIGDAKNKLSDFKNKISTSWNEGNLSKIKNTFQSLKEKVSGAKERIVNLSARIKEISVNKINLLKDKFIELKDKILLAKDKLIGFVGKLKDIAVAKITALKDAFINLANSISLAAIKEKLYAVWQGIVNGLTAIWNALLAMNPIMIVVIAITALIAALIYLYNTNETVRNAIDGLWQKMQELGAWIVSNLVNVWNTLVTAMQPVWDILIMIGNFLLNTFLFAWQTMIMVFTTVWNHVQLIVSIFSQFLSGQITLQAMLGQIWAVIKSMFFSVLGLIISRVGTFATQLVTRAINAGKGFLNGIINYITNLPGRIASILANVLSRIISAGSQWVSNARSKASSIVSGVTSQVSQLPGKVYTEFMNIGSRMLSAGSDLINKAKNIGKNIVDGLLGAMGIHSPGIIQTKVVSEFKDMVGKVKDWIKPAGETAKEFGETLVDQFGSPTLEANASLVQDLDAPKMNVGMDTTGLNSANQDVINQYGNLANLTGDSLNSMVSQDKLAFNSIKANDTAQMNIITTTVGNNMLQMSNNVKTNMDNIVAKNKQGFLSAKNNTTTQLNSMVNKTKTANSKMISSWKGMANDVISFANKIKTQSSSHFDQLGTKIGSFYKKLQNPGGFGAGPASSGGRVSTARRTGTNGLRAITNAIRKAQMPQTLTLSEIRNNPLISMDNIGSYITSNNNRFNVADLVRAGNIRIPVGLEDPFNKKGAGWLDNVGKHTSKIKSEADKWRMKGPTIIGKYPTSIGFKVGDFENGTPTIDYGTFKQMAEDVFGQTHYDFYYDEEKHGSWLGALRDGYLNCYHGAMALINFAQACGLSGSLVHGHWNQYGHYWANIAGHKMDVTGWQQQRNWTPAASHAGPAPKGLTFGEFVDAIKSTNETAPIIVNGGSNDADISGKVTVEHIHKFIDLPENISAEEVARLINDAPEDDNWLIKLIKLLVKNPDFQNLDLKEKLRLEAKNNRARGV